MIRTHTRTHVHVTFANPYLTCDQCKAWVTGWHDPEKCGCGNDGWQNLPCEHQAGVTSACPSWSPVDGCTCRSHLGHVPHAEPSSRQGYCLNCGALVRLDGDMRHRDGERDCTPPAEPDENGPER